MLIVKEKKKIWRNGGVSNVYTFYHANFKGVEFDTERQYVNLTKEGREYDLFFSDKDEEDHEVLPVLELPLLVKQRVCVVEMSYLPCLALGHD